MRVLVCSPVARESLERQLRALDVDVVWAEIGELPAKARDVDGIVLAGAYYSAALAQALAAEGNRCRWLQLLSAGYEQLLAHGVPPSIEVSNAGSVWSPIVAEHVMALLLALARRIPQVLAAQARQQWDDSIRTDMGMLVGGRMVIVGMGSIGGELARRARAFGMHVTGVSRSGRPHAEADRVVQVARLHEALHDADVVVVAVPLSAATQGLIDAAALAACPPRAVIANVGRGPVIDQQALLAALDAGRIAGAALDVTDPEPLTDGHPLWRHPRVIVSPHIGGAAPGRYNERLAALIVGNVRARLAGEPVSDRIDLAAA